MLMVVTAVPAIRHWRERPPAPSQPIRATWTAPANLAVGSGSEYPFGLAVAPDGRRIAFPAARDGHVRLWLQDLSTGAVTALPGTERAALPFWSVDGARVCFFADGAIKSFAIDDADIEVLASVAKARGAGLSPSGDLVFTNDDGGLSLVSGGGQGGLSPSANVSAGFQGRSPSPSVRALTAIDREAGELAHLFPAFLADGSHLVAFVHAASAARQGLYLIAVADGTRTRLTAAAASGVPSGDRLIYANDGALISQRLDAAARQLIGRAQVLGVRVGQSTLGHLLASAAADTLVFSEPMAAQHELVWVSRQGERLGSVGSPADFWSARIAPDGRRVAATVLDPLLRTLDVVSFDGRSLMPSRISLSIDADEWPAWSPDGLRVAWVQAAHSVMVRGAGAVLPAETIARFDENVRVTDWTPDGAGVLVSRTSADTREDLWLVPIRGGGAPRVAVATPFSDVQGAISPDGRWIAYSSDEPGEFEVYVEAVRDRSPEPGTRERVSSGGGSDPRWSRTGQELFFRRGSEIHVATPAVGRGQNAVAATSMLFKTERPLKSFDAAPDGRFLLVLPVVTPAPPATLVIHWDQPPKLTTTGP
jgi:eukaryotic-like serine/threonine-protein kinase